MRLDLETANHRSKRGFYLLISLAIAPIPSHSDPRIFSQTPAHQPTTWLTPTFNGIPQPLSTSLSLQPLMRLQPGSEPAQLLVSIHGDRSIPQSCISSHWNKCFGWAKIQVFSSPAISMKLARLKQKAYENWCRVNQSEDAIPIQDFKTEVHDTFGDLRKKSTWQRALARYYAHAANFMVLDAWSLITNTLNFKPDSEYYELRYLILDEFLMFQDGVDLIRMGLEQLYSNFTAEKREQARGFFEMVSGEQQTPEAALIDWQRFPALSATSAR